MDFVKIYDTLDEYLIQDISRIIVDCMYYNTHLHFFWCMFYFQNVQRTSRLYLERIGI
jgi:hypothetical protein